MNIKMLNPTVTKYEGTLNGDFVFSYTTGSGYIAVDIPSVLKMLGDWDGTSTVKMSFKMEGKYFSRVGEICTYSTIIFPPNVLAEMKKAFGSQASDHLITEEEIGYLKDAQQFHGWSDRAFSYVVRSQAIQGCQFLTRQQYAHLLTVTLSDHHYRDYIEASTDSEMFLSCAESYFS